MDEKWWPRPPDSFFHSLAESRHALALVEYYPTELTEHAAPKVLGISKLVHPSINVIALSVEKSRLKKGVVAFQHYDGSWHFQASAVDVELHGEYLVAAAPYTRNEDFAAARKILDAFAGISRLRFGPFLARRAAFSAVFDINTMNVRVDSDPFHWEPRPCPEEVDVEASFGVSGGTYDAKFRAIQLVGAAEATNDRSLKFLMLWIAIEVQIGDGNARRRFVGEHLRSREASEALEELRRIRNDFLKEGAEFTFSYFHEYCALSLLRLSIVGDPGVRDSLLSCFEQNFSRRSDFPEGSMLQHRLRTDAVF